MIQVRLILLFFLLLKQTDYFSHLAREFTTKKPELVKLHLEYNDFTKEQSFTSEHIISFPGPNNALSKGSDDR